MESSVSDRINCFIKENGISVMSLSKELGMVQTTLNRQLNGSSVLSSSVVEGVISLFPELSAEWLLRGKGSMYIATESGESEETRPRIPFDAAAGTLTVGVDGVMPYQCEQMPVVRAFPRYDFTILVRGESMAPEYQSGDEVACLYVRESTYTQWGRVHVLDTTQGVVIKRIYDRGDMVLCKSDNPRYEDFSIPKSEVFNIALVIGLIRRY